MEENNTTANNIGNILDSEMEQEIVECEDNGQQDVHPDFVQLDPEELEVNSTVTQTRKIFRRIEAKTSDEILKESRNLDKFQKKALHIIVEYVQGSPGLAD